MTRVVVAPLSEFGPDERRIVEVGGRSIGVFRVADEFFAIRNRCPHQGGPLCVGPLAPPVTSSEPGDVRLGDGPPLVACPWHGWEYELSTGQSFMGPGEPGVKAYDVHVEGGEGLGEARRIDDAPPRADGRVPGPYVAETFPVYVEADYVVLDA